MFRPLLHLLVRYWRIYFVLVIGAGIFIQIVALLPRGLEEDLPAEELTPSDLGGSSVLHPRKPGFENEIPEYTIKGFTYVSVQRGVKQWKVIADEAFFYEKKGIVTLREVHADIYDEKGNITVVEASEGEYEMTSRNLDLYTDVLSRFPDGLLTQSEAMHYNAQTRVMVVPPEIAISGHTLPEFGKDQLNFRSLGATYYGNESRIFLHRKVYVRINSPKPDGTFEGTDIYSDKADIDRAKNQGFFSMEPVKGPPNLVLMEQPNMKCTSWTAKFYFSAHEKQVKQIDALRDVTIIEYPKPSDENDVRAQRNEPPSPRVATGGAAEFYATENKIVLMSYPQVVQDHDTVTGEVIVIFRDKDIVQVERSNAYSERKQKP